MGSVDGIYPKDWHNLRICLSFFALLVSVELWSFVNEIVP